MIAKMKEDVNKDSKVLISHLLPYPASNILQLSSFRFHHKGDPQMARKPMTKSQIVSHFAGKFDLSKKASAAIINEVAALAVAETKKAGSFTLPGVGKLVLVKRKARSSQKVRKQVVVFYSAWEGFCSKRK
ncbi:MAG: HU family DNA-binding protein [Deltaproteobacteria bacterium]|nr:HU family DNA-binding protein [Deltaproteobacteria bacterium]